MKTYMPMIVQMPQEIIESEIFCRLVPLKRLLNNDCAVKLKQDFDNDIQMEIYHYEYVERYHDERWVRVWGRFVSPRTVCTLADVQNLIWELWESVPAEFKKVSEDKA